MDIAQIVAQIETLSKDASETVTISTHLLKDVVVLVKLLKAQSDFVPEIGALIKKFL